MGKLLYFTWIFLLTQIYQVQCLIVESLRCTDMDPFMASVSNITTLSIVLPPKYCKENVKKHAKVCSNGICNGLALKITNDDGKIIPDIRNTTNLVMVRLDWSNTSPRVIRDRVGDTRSYFLNGVQLINTLDVTSRVLSISSLGTSFEVAIGSMPSGLTVAHGCGLYYLRAALYIVSTSPALQNWISYNSVPIVVACNEADFDLQLYVTWGATNQNASNQVTPTIVPGKTTLADAIPNLSIFLNHLRGDSVLPRTPLNSLGLWVYIRKMSHDLLTSGTMPAEVSQFRLGDIMLNDGRFNHPGVSAGNSYEIRNLYSLTLPKPYICGEAVIIISLDPTAELFEMNRDNNIAIIPVTVDCWGSSDLMGAKIGMCMVVPDDTSSGKRAWFYTAGIPYGYGEVKAYDYQAEDKTFKKMTVVDNPEVNPAAQQFADLRVKASFIECPDNPSEPDSIASTVDSLSQLVSNIRSRFLARNFQNSEQVLEQQRLGTILQATSGVLTAGGAQGQGILQQFMDGMLAMLFNNMLQYPGTFPGSDPDVNYTVRQNGSRGDAEWAPYPVDSYHSMLAQMLSMFMSVPEWPLPFPNSQLGRALPKFFNQLLWSPETLSKSTARYTGLPADMISALRDVLVMVLKQQLPRSLDPLGSLIPVLNITLPDLAYGMPIEASALQSMIDSLYTAVETVRNYQISITTSSPTSTPTVTMTPTRPPNVTVTMANSSTLSVATTVPSTTARLNTTFNSTTLPPFTPPSSLATTRANNVTTAVNATTPLVNMTTARNPNATTANTNVSMVTVPANMTTRNPNVTLSPMGNNTLLPRLSADLISRLSTVMNLRDTSLLNRFTVLSAFLGTIRDSNTVSQLTSLIRQVQGSLALRDQWMLSEGMFAPVPKDLLCRRQVTVDLMKRLNGPNFAPSLPLYWNTDESTSSIFRGDLSTITGRVYWTKVAVCSCESGNSGSYMAYDPMNPGQSSGDMGAKPPK